jgi:hypothetical protein
MFMGKKGETKYHQLIKPGDVFNDWTVLSEPYMGGGTNLKGKPKNIECRVLCRCSCGFENDITSYSLYSGTSKRCWKCGYSRKMEENPAWKGYKEIPYSWFSNYFERKNNNRNKRSGNITIQQVHELWISQDKKCALTGLPIDWIKREDGVSCSIDRISSDGEYTIDNIQLVHKDINLMKNHFDQDYFIQMCKLVCDKSRI